MSPENKRLSAVKLADAVNKIEGAPISEYAMQLSTKWANNEITGEEMVKLLILAHKRT